MAFSMQADQAARRKSIPRPPPSPLRPSSPRPLTPTTPQQGSPQSSSRRLSVPVAPATPPPKTRARDLLRKHYGLGIGPPPPLPGGKPNPMDFGSCAIPRIGPPLRDLITDSPAFDAKSYYEQLITTSSLPVLLKRENDLFSGKEMLSIFVYTT